MESQKGRRDEFVNPFNAPAPRPSLADRWQQSADKQSKEVGFGYETPKPAVSGKVSQQSVREKSVASGNAPSEGFITTAVKQTDDDAFSVDVMTHVRETTDKPSLLLEVQFVNSSGGLEVQPCRTIALAQPTDIQGHHRRTQTTITGEMLKRELGVPEGKLPKGMKMAVKCTWPSGSATRKDAERSVKKGLVSDSPFKKADRHDREKEEEGTSTAKAQGGVTDIQHHYGSFDKPGGLFTVPNLVSMSEKARGGLDIMNKRLPGADSAVSRPYPESHVKTSNGLLAKDKKQGAHLLTTRVETEATLGFGGEGGQLAKALDESILAMYRLCVDPKELSAALGTDASKWTMKPVTRFFLAQGGEAYDEKKPDHVEKGYQQDERLMAEAAKKYGKESETYRALMKMPIGTVDQLTDVYYDDADKSLLSNDVLVRTRGNKQDLKLNVKAGKGKELPGTNGEVFRRFEVGTSVNDLGSDEGNAKGISDYLAKGDDQSTDEVDRLWNPSAREAKKAMAKGEKPAFHDLKQVMEVKAERQRFKLEEEKSKGGSGTAIEITCDRTEGRNKETGDTKVCYNVEMELDHLALNAVKDTKPSGENPTVDNVVTEADGPGRIQKLEDTEDHVFDTEAYERFMGVERALTGYLQREIKNELKAAPMKARTLADGLGLTREPKGA